MVQPDISIVSVGVTITLKTSQLASQKVADKVTQITQILKKNNIKSEDIRTESLSIYPQYEYPDGKVQLVGQTAQQTLTVTVRKIDKNGGNLGAIVDQLVAVDGLQFNGLRFDKEDKTEAQKQCRKYAYEDAKKKAGEYAGLAYRTLGKVLTIVDSSIATAVPIYRSADAFVSKRVGTDVPVGDQEIICSVSTIFAFK